MLKPEMYSAIDGVRMSHSPRQRREKAYHLVCDDVALCGQKVTAAWIDRGQCYLPHVADAPDLCDLCGARFYSACPQLFELYQEQHWALIDRFERLVPQPVGAVR